MSASSPPLAVLAAVGLVVACSQPSKKANPARASDTAAVMNAPSDAPRPAPRARSCPGARAELDRIARCFHRGVSVLQAQPKAGRLGAFLARAKKTGKLPSECAKLVVPAAGEVLKLSAGQPVRFRSQTMGEDLYAGGRTVLHLRYRFSADGCAERSQSTIQLSVGK